MKKTNKIKTEIRIRLRTEKAISLYNQFIGLTKSQTDISSRKIKYSLNEILEIHFTKFLENYLLEEQFDSLEEKLFNVLQIINKRNRNNVYTYVDQLFAQMIQNQIINDKKLTFLINTFVEKYNLPLDNINNPHEQNLNNLDWVRALDKKLQIEYDVWCQKRKINRKTYEK